MIKAVGLVHYYSNSVKLLCDKEIGNYYYSLIPKYKNARRQAYDSHITIVRDFESALCCHDLWDNHRWEIIPFEYEPIIYESPPYFFLKCWSEDIGKIREELKLPKYREGFDCYHMTVGNIKEIK